MLTSFKVLPKQLTIYLHTTAYIQYMNILLIEDDLDIASNTGQFFAHKGHSVDFAYDGEIGLKTALDFHFDVLIVDLILLLSLMFFVVDVFTKALI